MPANATALDPEALAAMEDKYTILLQMRRRRDTGENTDRATLAQLSQRFPGALRELDRNRAAALQERLEIVQAVREGRLPPPDWLAWIWNYHRLLSAALAVRLAAAGVLSAPLSTRANHRLDPSERRLIQTMAEKQTGVSIDAEFLMLALAPPDGRLAPTVLSTVAAQFGTTAAQVGDTLFPPR